MLNIVQTGDSLLKEPEVFSGYQSPYRQNQNIKSNNKFLSKKFFNPLTDLIIKPVNFLEKINEFLHYEVFALWLFEEPLNGLRCKQFVANDQEKFKDFEEITRSLLLSLGSDIAGHCFLSKVPLLINDLRDYKASLRRSQVLEASLQAVYSVPLEQEGQIVGVCEFFSHQPFDLDEQFLAQFNKLMVAENHFDTFEPNPSQVLSIIKKEEDWQTFLESVDDGVIVLDDQDNCLFANSIAQDNMTSISLPQNHQRFEQKDFQIYGLNFQKVVEDFEQGNYQEIMTLSPKVESEQIWLKITQKKIFDDQNNLKARIIVFRDITHHKIIENKQTYDSVYDNLTKLCNRTVLVNKLYHLIENYQQNSKINFALLFIDIDRFKLINDSLGHLIGDEILVLIADRLRDCVRGQDLVVRFGGDEFVILLENTGDISDVIKIAERINQKMSSVFKVNDYELFVKLSIGIALNDSQYYTPEDLIRNASTAMYQAKRQNHCVYQIFNDSMSSSRMRILQLENDLRKAINDENLQLNYQPIFTIDNKEMVGVETLVRWQNSDHGWISPAEFIPIAEETGLIIPLGLWILEKSCQQMKMWQDQFGELEDWTINVNVSGKQLLQIDFVRQVEAILKATGLNPHNLKLEITETVLIDNPQLVVDILNKIRQIGVKLALDDFGTGYSSLSYLHQFSFDTLKIDRSFIQSIDVNSEKLGIIKAIINLANSLGMNVVAEGIEEGSQLAHLKVLKCQYGQGYLFSKPLDCKLVEVFIETNLQNKNRHSHDLSLNSVEDEQLSKEKLLLYLEKMRQEIEELKQEKEDLEILLETTTEHAELFESELDEEIDKYQQNEAQLQKLNQELESLSLLDGLTQIANRRHFDDYLKAQWDYLAETQEPLSLILADVDCFKKYNDYYGHQAGDQCLITVAGCLVKSTNPKLDLVARYGGEEFALVLPYSSVERALKIAQAIRMELKQHNLPHVKSFVKPYVTISLGVVTTIPTKDSLPESLIHLADKALYEAKNQGRDRFMLFSN